MTIRAHFDGKVFVPDEPVHLPAGRNVIIDASDVSTAGTTGRELLEYLQNNPQIKVIWDEIAAGRDSVEVADDLRRQSQLPRRFEE